MAEDRVTQGGQDVGAVLAGSGDVAADGVAVPGGFLAAEPAGDFLLGLRRARVPFGLVGGGRDAQVIDEAQDVVVAVAQCFEQGAVLELLAALAAGYLAQAEDDAVPEGVLQRCGDQVGHGGQVLVAGGVRGVDEAAQRVGDLDGPVRAGVGLGGVGEVAKEMGCAELVDQPGEGVVVLIPVMDDDGAVEVGQHERGERRQVAVAEQVIGVQAGARDQQVPLAGLRAGPDPDRGFIGADHVCQDDQRPDQLVHVGNLAGGPREHGVHEPG